MTNLNYVKIRTFASERTFFNCEEFLVFLHIPGSHNSKVIFKGKGIREKYNYELKNKPYFNYMYNFKPKDFLEI